MASSFFDFDPNRVGDKLMSVMLQTTATIAAGEQDRLEAVTRDWEDNPEFKTELSRSGNRINISITTDSIVFHWVDQGTQPHVIPRGGSKKTMTIRGGYTPISSPGNLRTNSGGGKSSSSNIRTTLVKHPGIDARNFSGQVSELMQKQLNRSIPSSVRGVRF